MLSSICCFVCLYVHIVFDYVNLVFCVIIHNSEFRIVERSEDVRHSGGYSVGVPPLPIPNREVKPDRADGTAFVGE